MERLPYARTLVTIEPIKSIFRRPFPWDLTFRVLVVSGRWQMLTTIWSAHLVVMQTRLSV